MDWIDLEFFRSDKFKEIVKFLQEERKSGKNVLPPNEEMLHAFELTPFEEVKVVILGQDPYPTASPERFAHGLAFSINDGVNRLPKSLINIFRELREDVGVQRGDKGNLEDWARQGVLLLNTSLTVVEGKPGSHSSVGWESLITDVLRLLGERRQNLVFILWGNHAQRYQSYIDRNRHCIIKSPHPSPLSAHRGFFGSKPFSKTNTYLKEHNIEPIKW